MSDDWTQHLNSDQHRDESPKVREDYVRAPFAYPGGKSGSVKKIIPLLPIREKYTECCGGAGSILLARDSCPLEVFNDKYAGVTCFYRVLRDPLLRPQLLARLEQWIHSREEFIWCHDSWAGVADPVERAARWFYMVKMSFGGQGRNFARATSTGNMIAEKYGKTLPLLPIVAKRMQNVLIENQDMFQILTDFDDPDTVHYIDPTYVKYSKGMYEHELCRQDHFRLCDTIMTMTGFVALSGYPNDIYDSYHWDHREEWEVDVTAGAMAFLEENNMKGKEHLVGRRKQTEVLWIRESK